MPFRLIRLRGLQSAAEWPLSGDGPFIIGRPHADFGRPDIDLSPDRSVSRQHAKLWFGEERWWIRDLGSAAGTRVGGRRLQPAETAAVCAGDDIEIGGTSLALFPANRYRLEYGMVSVDFTLGPCTGAALASSRVSFVTDIEARNRSDETGRGAVLTIALPGFARASVSIPALDGWMSVSLTAVALWFDESALREVREARCLAPVVDVDGVGFEVSGAAVWVLARDEWSRCAEHRRVLAAYVFPAHPRVVALAADAVAGRPAPPPPEELLRSVYEQLHSVWSIGYRFEVPANAAICQKVRLPDQVLSDVIARVGQGTCLDLALLIAGALESLHAQPLLAVVETGDVWHALVGCRRVNRAALEVVLSDRAHLPADVAWVDPNGCTRDPSYRLDFTAACRAGERMARQEPLIFGIDVSAARREGLSPVPIAIELAVSAEVRDALEAAEDAASAAGTQMSTVTLLIGLLEIEGGLLGRAMGEGLRREDAVRRLSAALRGVGATVGPSRNFSDVVALAHRRAREENASAVLERHLIAALLAARSQALDDALRWLGTDRQSLDTEMRRIDEEYGRTQTDHSVFHAFAERRD